jgi:hypothetical protein
MAAIVLPKVYSTPHMTIYWCQACLQLSGSSNEVGKTQNVRQQDVI